MPCLSANLPGSDRVPEHRRKNRLERREISHHAAVNQSVERRHQTFLEQRCDNFPIRRVPADEQDLSVSGRFWHGLAAGSPERRLIGRFSILV